MVAWKCSILKNAAKTVLHLWSKRKITHIAFLCASFSGTKLLANLGFHVSHTCSLSFPVLFLKLWWVTLLWFRGFPGGVLLCSSVPSQNTNSLLCCLQLLQTFLFLSDTDVAIGTASHLFCLSKEKIVSMFAGPHNHISGAIALPVTSIYATEWSKHTFKCGRSILQFQISLACFSSYEKMRLLCR